MRRLSGGVALVAVVARSGACAALDVPSLGLLADVSTCRERRYTYRVEQMIETEMPPVETLLDVTP